MQSTSGATLELLNGNFTNSASGVIKAGDTSSVLVSGSLVSGGTLETAGSGVIHFTGGSELGTITSTGALQVDTNQVLFLANKSTLTNEGTLTLAGGGAELRTVGAGSATLAGGGTVFLGGDGNNLIRDASSATGSITNQDNTIHGAGNIGDGQLSFDNQLHGTIIADNTSHALVIQPNGSGFSNEGTLRADPSSTLQLTGGPFTNFSGTTLTGGTYQAFSGTIQFNGANIVTNAATILLDGATSRIIDQSSNDAFRNFAANASAGSFTIQDGRNLTTPGDFSNAGIVHVGANSTFTVGSGGANSYTQTAGTTQVDGTLHASMTSILGGTLSGTGTVMGNVSNTGGTVMPGTPGVAGVLTITGNYTDPPSSHLFIQIGGPDSLHGLAQLDVDGTASLSGMLDVSLINGFMPTNGELFTILTSGGLSGSFTDNTIVDGNVTFLVEYSPQGSPNAVVLDAIVSQNVPEPASVVLLGAGAVGLLAYGRHRRRRAGA